MSTFVSTAKKGVIITLTLYVDDLLLLGGNALLLDMLKKLMRRFRMTDMGNVSLVLGMQVTRDRKKGILTISQEDYTDSMLERFRMSECKPQSTPGLGPELSLEQPERKLLVNVDKKRYQAITGSFMYLTQVNRYEILYEQLLGLRRSLPRLTWLWRSSCRYLAGTMDFSIVYKRGGFQLTAFSDANWGNNDNGISMSSYVMMMASAPVGFTAGLQTLTTMSTMEAERWQRRYQ